MAQCKPAYPIFRDRSEEDWVRHNTCHELTHASTDHLHLPLWLHEGLAMLAVDLLAGAATVRPDTLPCHVAGVEAPGRSGPSTAPDAMVRRAVRGYWTTRYLAETQSDFLRDLLAETLDRISIEERVASCLGLPREALWEAIEERLLARYAET
jgi:hypothetical protein